MVENVLEELPKTATKTLEQRPAERSRGEYDHERCPQTMRHRHRPYEFSPCCASRDSVRHCRPDELRAALVYPTQLPALSRADGGSVGQNFSPVLQGTRRGCA